MTPAQRLTREQRRAQNRQALIDSAMRLLVSDGVNASLDAVSADAGLTTGAVYSNFGGKSGLIRAVVEAQLEGATEAMVQFGQAEGSLEDVLRMYTDFVEVYRAAENARALSMLALQVVQMAAEDEDFRRAVAPLKAREMEALAGALTGRSSRHLPAGTVTTPDEGRAIGFVLRTLVDGYTARWLALDQPEDVPLADAAEALGALIPALRRSGGAAATGDEG